MPTTTMGLPIDVRVAVVTDSWGVAWVGRDVLIGLCWVELGFHGDETSPNRSLRPRHQGHMTSHDLAC